MSNERHYSGYFNNQMSLDLVDMLCGEYLGEGISREVYVYRPNPTFVIKLQTLTHSFDNATEWDVWNRVKDTEHAKWFAPCHHISPNGIWMIQKRTNPMVMGQLPKKVPAFLTDTKRTNVGEIDGQLCFHDYSLNLLMENGMTKRMVNADWRDE